MSETQPTSKNPSPIKDTPAEDTQTHTATPENEKPIASASSDNASTEESSPPAKQIFALVIEDDPDAAFIYTQALRDNGYIVEHIAHGEEASRKLKTLQPDIVLLDLHLPSVSGVSLLQQIRSTPHLAETPVVLVTADNRTADSIEGDAQMVLLKPATYTQVKELVKRIMA